MLIRTVTGAAIIAVLIVVVSVAPVWVLPFALAAMTAIAAHEMVAATGLSAVNRPFAAIAVIFAALVPFWVYLGEPDVWSVLGILVLVMSLFAAAMTSRTTPGFGEICIAFFAATALPYLLCSAIRLVGLGGGDAQRGRFLVYVPIVGAFASDTFAYLTGRAFGRRKLCPDISPKKTVEGSLGGFVMAPVLVVLYVFILSRTCGYSVSYPSAIVCGVASAFAGQLGDLSMSYVKRRYSVKDFGRILPGHGGVLDRFDSVLFAAPLCEVIMRVLPVIW